MDYTDGLNREIAVNDVFANRILDLRIPKGTSHLINIDALVAAAKELDIVLIVKEY